VNKSGTGSVGRNRGKIQLSECKVGPSVSRFFYRFPRPGKFDGGGRRESVRPAPAAQGRGGGPGGRLADCSFANADRGERRASGGL